MTRAAALALIQERLGALDYELETALNVVQAAADAGARALVEAIEACARLVLSKPAGYSALWVAGDLCDRLRAYNVAALAQWGEYARLNDLAPEGRRDPTKEERAPLAAGGASDCAGCQAGLAICPHHKPAHHVSHRNQSCALCTTVTPPRARRERMSEPYPKGKFCGCCGRPHRTASDHWCADCAGHIDPRQIQAHDRTWSAQHGTACPHEDPA